MSGGNTNTTISYPGSDWKVLWGNGAFDNFQLDIVGFLAVLGEGSVTANAQVSALSTLFYLPRLIPAPQALLWPTRPTELEPTKAVVTGVESGIRKDHVHHVANILLGEDLPPFGVRCVEVTKARRDGEQTWKDRFFRGERKQKPTGENEKMNTSPKRGPPLIKAKANGPTSWVTLISFGLSLILFTFSILYGDGMSLIATLLLSFLSTLIGIVNKWSLKLPQGVALAKPCHVVIRYPNGSFLVVKCTEDVARELYFAPEEIEYNVQSAAVYRLVSLAGTLMLMGGVICLANSKLQLQFAWAGAYITTNIAHFLAAAVPSKMHWDLSCYELQEQGVEGGPYSKTFTEALWKTIVFTKRTDWIQNGGHAPRTKVWDRWLEEADERANSVGTRYGELKDPQRVGGVQHGTVYAVPLGWQPKQEWDRIDNKFMQEEGSESTSSNYK